MSRDDGGAEAGFTLLELVIALSILSFAVGGVIAVFGSALRTTSIDVHRADATGLATRSLATLRSTPYAELATGTRPSTTVVIDNQSYSVAVDVEWTSSSGNQAQAYKRATASVRWTDQALSHLVQQDSVLYPGGLGPYVGPTGPSPTTTTTVVGCPVPTGPSGIAVASPATGDPAVDVSWVEPSSPVPVAAWEVDTSPDGTTWTTGRIEATLAAGATHVVEIGGLAPGVTYTARLQGFAACGVPWVSTAVTAATATPAVSGSGCAIGSVALSTPIASRAAVGGGLTADITLEVAVTSSCSGGLWAGVVTSSGTTSVVNLSSGARGAVTARLPATGMVWDLGRHTVEIFAGSAVPGPLPSTTPLAAAQLCVEGQGVATC